MGNRNKTKSEGTKISSYLPFHLELVTKKDGTTMG
jgi:hypothetical protein